MTKPIIDTLDNNFVKLKDGVKDLTNKQFNSWKVLGYKGNQYWLCECQCSKHTLRILRANTLEYGRHKSCGCSRKNMGSLNDLIGNTFEDITVLESLGRGRYKCQCKCGAIKEMAGSDIRRSRGIKCNHFKQDEYDKYIGKHFGELEVIGTNGAKAICRCSCGEIIEYYISGLIQGKKKSCGCLRDKKSKLLIGKQFGYLTVKDYLGNGVYDCECICGNHVKWGTGNLVKGNIHSCGCKTAYTLTTKKDEQYNRTRTSEQIEAVCSRDSLIQFIRDNTKNKPTALELANILGVSIHASRYYIHKYEIEDLIEDASFFSNSEKEVGELLESFGIHIERHNKNILNGQELDIYIPEKKIAIEFNGTYWHSDIQKDKNYHQNKTIECAKHNIRLIHIFEYEWINHNEKIINFLRNIFTEKEIIYARNCKLLTVVDTDDEKSFLDNNHLQGYAKSEIKIGLTYNNELISILTLGAPRFNNEYQYEIIRYCTKNGYAIIGGLEKLFKCFVNMYKPTSVITYSDIAKFTGNCYTKVGFAPTKNPITQPNYVWTDNKEVISRYKTQKHLLEKQGLVHYEDDTEDTIMKRLGYYKIYDSGNIKLEWRI